MASSVPLDATIAHEAPGVAVAGRSGDLRDVVRILRERIALVLVPPAIAGVLALAYLAGAPRVYTGVTSILIDARTRPAVGDVSPSLNTSPDAVLVESQVRLISSEPVLRRVVAEEDLAEDPEFVPTRPGLRSRILQAIGLGGRPATTEDQATKALLNLAPRVVIKRSERTYIADIEVTSTDAGKAARLANAVARAYLADQQAARTASAARDSDWVREQIVTMQTGLQEAERKAETFRREHGILGANGKLLNEQDLGEAATALATARARATETKARYDQIQRIIAAGRNLDALPDALRSPAIERLRGQLADIIRQQASLRQTLGDRHPALLESEQQLRDTRRLIADELARVQAGLANESQTAQANVAGLDRHLQDLKQATNLSNESRLHLDELQRDVDARRAVYDRFLRARDTVREQAVDAPIGRIVAPALTPQAPSSPKTFAVLALSIAAGLAVGIGLGLTVDLLGAGRSIALPRFVRKPVRLRFWPALRQKADPPRFETAPTAPLAEAEAEEPVSFVPILGVVPAPFSHGLLARSVSGGASRLRAAWPTAAGIDPEPPLPGFLEAMAEIGTALALQPAEPDEPGRVLVATSIRGAANRSLFALGLASYAATAGLRALVIDADGTDGMLRDIVAPGAQPALLDLMGTNRPCFTVLSPAAGSLRIVPALADEAKLVTRLEARADTTRIDGIAGNFDLVIFDGPSIGRMARLNTIAGGADAVILVAPPEATRAELEQAATLFDLPPSCSMLAVLADAGEAASASRAA